MWFVRNHNFRLLYGGRKGPFVLKCRYMKSVDNTRKGVLQFVEKEDGIYAADFSIKLSLIVK